MNIKYFYNIINQLDNLLFEINDPKYKELCKLLELEATTHNIEQVKYFYEQLTKKVNNFQ